MVAFVECRFCAGVWDRLGWGKWHGLVLGMDSRPRRTLRRIFDILDRLSVAGMTNKRERGSGESW